MGASRLQCRVGLGFSWADHRGVVALQELAQVFGRGGAGSASLALRLDYRDFEGRNAGVTTTLFAGTEVFREDDLPDGKALQKLLKGGSQRPPASPLEPAEAAVAAPAETVEVT